MVSYSLEEAIEKRAPVGNPWADGERPNPWLQPSEADDA